MDHLTRRAIFALAGGGAAYVGLASAGAAPRRSSARRSGTQDRRPAPIQHIEVNGARLAYVHHAGPRRRPPLVFVHGYALRSTGSIYAPLIDALTADFDVYALDMRGHGASASSFANWSQAAIADDVAGFVKKLGLRGAVYAGHSLGGFTGLFAQIRHPGTFSALALLATAVASGGAPPAGLKESFVTRGKDPIFARSAFAPMYVRPGPGDIERAVASVGLIDASVHEAFFSNFAATVITERLREVRVPVLLVNGAKDVVVSPAEQHLTAAELARGKDVTFSAQGHMLPIENPAATARELLAFFRHDVGAT